MRAVDLQRITEADFAGFTNGCLPELKSPYNRDPNSFEK